LVENPLALTPEELTHLEQLVDELSTAPAGCPTVFVGFNRRYSPYVVRLRERTAKRLAPLHLIYRMNAAYLPPEHWVHGPEGGGRIRGEACHIFDLFHYCVGAPATAVHATGVGVTRRDVVLTDNYTATICYADGSLCTLLHTTQGGEELSKEAMEVHVGQQSYLLDDYRQLRGFGTKLSFRTRRQNKGHYPELIAFQQAIAGTLDRKELWAAAVDATRTTFEVDRQIRRQT
jgi:predicted dehydrogenase